MAKPKQFVAEPDQHPMLTEATNRVVAQLSKPGQPQKAISTDQWIGIATALFDIIKQCRSAQSPQQFKAAAKNPSLSQRLSVRLALRREAGKPLFLSHGRELVDAALDTAANATNEEVQKIIAEAHE